MLDSPYVGVTPVASLIPAGGTVTLVEGQTFALSDHTGDMHPRAAPRASSSSTPGSSRGGSCA